MLEHFLTDEKKTRHMILPKNAEYVMNGLYKQRGNLKETDKKKPANIKNQKEEDELSGTHNLRWRFGNLTLSGHFEGEIRRGKIAVNLPNEFLKNRWKIWEWEILYVKRLMLVNVKINRMPCKIMITLFFKRHAT